MLSKRLVSIIGASIISISLVGCQSTSWEHEYDFTYTAYNEEKIEKYRSNRNEEVEHLRNQDNFYKQVVKKGLEIVKEEDRALTLDEYNYLAYLLGGKKDFNYPKQLSIFEETCHNGYNMWRDEARETQIECNNDDDFFSSPSRNSLIDFELIKEHIDRMLYELEDVEITNTDLVNMEQNIIEGTNKLRNTNFNSYYNGEDYNCDCFICGNQATLHQGDKGYDFYECVSCGIFTSIQDMSIFLNNVSFSQEEVPMKENKETPSELGICHDCGQELPINSMMLVDGYLHCGCTSPDTGMNGDYTTCPGCGNEECYDEFGCWICGYGCN